VCAPGQWCKTRGQRSDDPRDRCLYQTCPRHRHQSARGEDTLTSLMATEAKALTFAVLLLPVQIHVCRLMMDSWLEGLSAYCYSTRGNSRGSVFIVSLLGGESSSSSQNYAQAGCLHTSTFSLSLSLVPHTHSRWRALRHCPAGGVGWGSGCSIIVSIPI